MFKAVALQNLVGEFAYRLYDTVNETGYEDVLEYLGTLAIGEDDILQYCENDPEILVEPEDFELTVKNALDTITERTADKLLEEFSADDLFDYLFTATYDFEQDFTYEFEDTDEFQAFVDSNADQLDNYKEEYPAVMRWVDGGALTAKIQKFVFADMIRNHIRNGSNIQIRLNISAAKQDSIFFLDPIGADKNR